ncbi:MAG: hypothetical protein ACXVDB_09710 [Tumebacillaceae bacterium]
MADTPREQNVENSELSYVQSQQNTINVEEFPDGPYGSQVFLDQKLGKSTPWEPGQQSTSRNQDENPAFSDDLAAPHDEDLPDL